ETYKLPSGLTVVLIEDHRLPRIAVSVTYQASYANETRWQRGMAHVINHLMMGPTQHIVSQREVLASMGSELLPVMHSPDQTWFGEVVPSSELASALWLESERMAFAVDLLDAGHLAQIVEEIRAEEKHVNPLEQLPASSINSEICRAL